MGKEGAWRGPSLWGSSIVQPVVRKIQARARRAKLGVLVALWRGTPFSGTSEVHSYVVKKPTDINYL